MTERRDFLFEIGTEELPPKALRPLSEALAESIRNGLRKARLGFDDVDVYAAPRRLAVCVRQLASIQPQTVDERRGPALTAAFDDQGNPTQAALGFARSCGVDVNVLETQESEKGAWLYFRKVQQGKHVRELLPGMMMHILAALPVPRRMRWNVMEETFIRPVHWLVMLYGDEVLPLHLFGLEAGRETHGHRFHHSGALYLAEPAAYAPLLETEGWVMADFSRRREAVRAQVMEVAAAMDARVVIDESLLEEVTAMVEWPSAIRGYFDRRFLAIPPEVLISAMKAHQKYFHLVDGRGHLQPAFITVCNIDSADIDVVRAGNERVIRPRLSDAMFFWEQDRKQTLAARLARLDQVIFQRELGSMHRKSERVSRLAGQVAHEIEGNILSAERAGRLSKCDLLTHMVGEFPDLQGIMGGYYAEHDGEPHEVAQAIKEQYFPRFSGDQIPLSVTGQALAVADRVDTLVGIFGIGQQPTGDKDPFALRRAALGVLRIIIERKLSLNLHHLLDAARQGYQSQGLNIGAQVIESIYEFMMDRLRSYYHESGINAEVFEAVLSRRPAEPLDFDARLRAVALFQTLPEATSLAAANKRIINILRKVDEHIPDRVDDSLLREDAEISLVRAMNACNAVVQPLIERGDYAAVLKSYAGLRAIVDDYFDNIRIMTEDNAVRANRLSQLARLRDLFQQVADLSCLHGQT